MFDKDEKIKVFKDPDKLIYTDEFLEWLMQPVDNPEKWLGVDYKKEEKK